jgi:co-chaperonin GroES (HSP10)
METIRNIYHVSLDSDKYNYTHLDGGLVLERDYGFHIEAEQTINLRYYNYYSGTVKTTPRQLDKIFKHDDPIAPETYVYFHHFVQENDMPVYMEGKDDLKWCSHDNIFCRIEDGVIIPREGKVIVEPIYESEEDISKNGILLKPKAEIIHERGILRFISPADKELEEAVDKTVIFTESCEYMIEIEGNDYYVMDTDKILGVVE